MGAGIWAVFANDTAVVLRNVFPDWRWVRSTFDEMCGITGLVLHLWKTAIVNFTRRGNLVVKDVACDSMPCVVADVGKYTGVWIGPGSASVRWRHVVVKYLSRARHIKSMALPVAHVPVAYNYLVASVLSYPATFFDMFGTIRRAEHIGLAVTHSAPHVRFLPGH